MRAAAIQMNSTADKQRNLATAERLVRAAAADGSTLVVLPEKFNALGTHDDLVRGAEPLDGTTLAWARGLARELGIDLVAGSIAERRDGHDKLSNTSVHIGPDGRDRALYRKIHMFDVTVGGREYRESDSEQAGDEIVTSEAADGVSLGLTVCYDLRFPELFRILAVRGARVLSVPSAFTAVTGAAHWDTLVRARAIENQAFVVAADQIGVHPGVDKRRLILDAAITVFAQQGFHHCRVSDVADEAGVAYGLVYHYFDSKEEMLNELFLERWQIMLDAIGEIDGRDELAPREKLHQVAGFIIDSYRHEPDLMKVIIVEVTRAANSFGRLHLEKIREAYAKIADIVESARQDGTFKQDISAQFAAMCFYGAIEQLLSGWIFDLLPQTEEEFERAKTLVVEAICGGLEVSPSPSAPAVSG